MIAIRGATTVKHNTRDEMLTATKEMLQEIIDKNRLKVDDITSITFTATNDLDAVYPAVAAREIGIELAALLCMQEMHVVGSLQKCIRVLFHCENGTKQRDVIHVYQRDAVVLRPDLIS